MLWPAADVFGVCLATMLTMSEFRRRRFSFSYHLQTQRCSPLWVLQERHARKGEALFSGIATTLTVLNGALAEQTGPFCSLLSSSLAPLGKWEVGLTMNGGILDEE